ncbi:MAG: Oligopeptide transport ATP-binding protein OppD [Candidatus Heimdallarchaeota archaeon LC_2]|nr:MAG: Oligopeptide transport ATP-binding protein OppD [Candidatus Heimdallarchaeota archaeon LC_2]
MSKTKEQIMLSVENIYTYFRTESGIVKALDGVSFNVKKNEAVGIVGESGCGKTVTAQSILRILPKNGDTVAGEINYLGIDLLKLTNRQMQKVRGSEIALLFQNPLSALNPVMTISAQMLDVIQLHRGVDKNRAREIAIEMLDAVGIPDAKDRIDDYPHQYSGGMRQRILIARALTLQPKLLIADEPTTALDVTIQAQVLDIIQKMRERFGLSLMLITHNLGVVAENTDRIHIFYGGRVVESGPTREIFRDPKHPYTIALLESIPSFKDIKGELPTIAGTVPQLINPPPGCRFHPRCEFATDVCKTRPDFQSAGKDRFVACFHLEEVHKAIDARSKE